MIEDLQFLGDLSALDLETEYRSLKENPANSFYRPCLQHSVLYRRATGYFRSSVFLVTGASVIGFVERGGKIQLICSPELDADDIDSIALGYARRSDMLASRMKEVIDELLSDVSTAYNTRVLATLVSLGALEIKLAVRSDKKGIYHEKIGIFSDGCGNSVSFKGSTNETWSGWADGGNFESIEVFCNWRGGLEATRVSRHISHFDRLWAEVDPDVEVFAFPVDAVDHLKKSALKRLDDVSIEYKPSVAVRREPLAHQTSAIDAWKHAGKRGIFEHATGSGKTFTAIIALREHASANLPSIVLVPSRLLLIQWAKEIRDEIPEAALLLAGAGNDRWKVPRRLLSMTDPAPELGARIVLATMQTASSKEFIDSVAAGAHLLIVADEVHQTGSPQNSNIFNIDSGYRLGLSATPKRYGDPLGTHAMLDYFGEVVPPPITLQDAVEAGRLVPYEYYPHPINLTATEAADWKKISRDIQQEILRQRLDSDGKRVLSDKAKMLLIRRSRIAKKATAKVRLAISILKKEYEDGQSWLVYCEDSTQLNEVLVGIKEAGLHAAEYHSTMLGDRESTLSWFREYGGILVSIRCLDEGVDIPAISHGLILASSQNPRQFIQRRGRVLRRSSGKHVAVIHDAIVVPVDLENEPEQTSLLRAELVRSIEFAQHAINRAAGADLRSVAMRAGIEIDPLLEVGIEGDDDE